MATPLTSHGIRTTTFAIVGQSAKLALFPDGLILNGPEEARPVWFASGIIKSFQMQVSEPPVTSADAFRIRGFDLRRNTFFGTVRRGVLALPWESVQAPDGIDGGSINPDRNSTIINLTDGYMPDCEYYHVDIANADPADLNGKSRLVRRIWRGQIELIDFVASAAPVSGDLSWSVGFGGSKNFGVPGLIEATNMAGAVYAYPNSGKDLQPEQEIDLVHPCGPLLDSVYNYIRASTHCVFDVTVSGTSGQFPLIEVDAECPHGMCIIADRVSGTKVSGNCTASWIPMLTGRDRKKHYEWSCKNSRVAKRGVPQQISLM